MHLAELRKRHIQRARRWSGRISRPRYVGRAEVARRPRYGDASWRGYYQERPARSAFSLAALSLFVAALSAAAYFLSASGFPRGRVSPADRFGRLDEFLTEKLAIVRGIVPALSGRPAEAHEKPPSRPGFSRLLSDIVGFDTSDVRSFLSLPSGSVASSSATLPAMGRVAQVNKTAGPRGATGPNGAAESREAAGPAEADRGLVMVTPLRPPAAPAQPEPPRQQPVQPRRSPGPPVIAVYHSHSSEAYRPTSGQDYVWGRDDGVIRVGDRLAEVLTKRFNIGVVHSRKVHDYPKWRDAYANSHDTVVEILKKYPSVEIVLDIHRDSSTGLSEAATTAEINGQRVARVFIVVSTDAFGLPHPNWQENLAFARYLQGKMEEICPGLSRGIDLRQDGRWNQHLHPRAIILEIGSVLNTREEAERSAELVAYVLDQVVRELEIR